MLNYYENIKPKDEYIMKVEEKGNHLKVTFADGSIRFFENTEEVKRNLEYATQEQIQKILEKYSSESFDKKLTFLCTGIVGCLTGVLVMVGLLIGAKIMHEMTLLSGLRIGTMLATAGLFITYKMTYKEIDQLSSQINELQKLEYYQEQKESINSYFNENVKKYLKQECKDKLRFIERQKLEKKLTTELQINYLDLDRYTLKQLKRLSKEIKMEQTIGVNQKIDANGFQKTIGTIPNNHH